MILISTIIVNHNRKELLLKCLKSLEAQELVPDEIILLDNASTDGSAEAVRLEFPYVSIARNRRNLSFSVSCNQGINLAKGEFILLLNNDIVLDRYFVKSLLDIMLNDRRIGVAGGKVLSFNGKYIDSAGQFLAKSRKIVDRGYREADKGQYDRKGPVFSISASAAFYRRTMLEGIKEGKEYFDEDFEFFYEDMDIAWRARNKAWKVCYEPKAVAYHMRGATTKTRNPGAFFLKKYYIPRLSPELQSCSIRNRYLIMLKNDSVKDILRNFAFILWYEIKQACYIFFFNPALIIRIIKDRRLFLRSLRK
jgi:GT2 family glycosyltransferase